MVVQEAVTHQALMDSIWSAPLNGVLQDAVLFDVYRPQKEGGSVQLGEKSLAIRLVLQSTDETTLTEQQIADTVQAVVNQLGAQLGAKLRS